MAKLAGFRSVPSYGDSTWNLSSVPDDNGGFRLQVSHIPSRMKIDIDAAALPIFKKMINETSKLNKPVEVPIAEQPLEISAEGAPGKEVLTEKTKAAKAPKPALD